MATLRRAALILCAALAAPLAGSAPASADPSVALTEFGEFSGAAAQLGFDDLGLFNGDPVASVGDVNFSLSSGSAALYFEDNFARESGIEGVGSLSNFWGVPRPYPTLVVSFASAMHRVGFEARVNTMDQLVVTLFAGGAQVDQLVFPSRGSDRLYFYGVENTGGFDEVSVDALEGASGAFTLDNLTFESLEAAPPDPPGDPGGEEPPAEEPPVISCDGFESFPRADRGRHHRLPVRALLAELRDADGIPLTSDDLEIPPRLRVWFTPDSGGASVDVTERVARRGSELAFVGGRLQRWYVWVMPRRMERHGTYMAMLESGDPAAYTLDPTCADWTVNQRPKHDPKHKHRKHKHRKHERDDDDRDDD